MTKPYAELIGDPVTRSLSPSLHRHWLSELGLAGDYRPVRCDAEEAGAYFSARRVDPLWRGCNVTMPLKRAVLPLLDRLDETAAEIGAVNCIVPREGALIGYNTDVDGVAISLGDLSLGGRKAVVIGSGGAARAALVELRLRRAGIILLLRDPAAAPAGLEAFSFEQAPSVLGEAALVINATPLGMVGAPPMPAIILQSLRKAPGALAIDMVYLPARTAFLQEAEDAGLRTVDGYAMLTGQARRAFKLFFGVSPPAEGKVAGVSLRRPPPAD